MHFLRIIFLCGMMACGQLMAEDDAASSDVSKSAPVDKPTPIGDYISVLQQKIAALNAKVTSKQVDVDVFKKKLASIDKASADYAKTQASVDKATEELAALNLDLAELTARQKAEQFADDSLKKASAVIAELQQSSDDDADLSSLIDTPDAGA